MSQEKEGNKLRKQKRMIQRKLKVMEREKTVKLTKPPRFKRKKRREKG